MAGHLNSVFLALIVLAAISTFEVIPPLVSVAQFLGSSIKAGQRLFEVIDAPPLIREPAGLSPVRWINRATVLLPNRITLVTSVI